MVLGLPKAPVGEAILARSCRLGQAVVRSFPNVSKQGLRRSVIVNGRDSGGQVKATASSTDSVCWIP